MVDSLLNDKKGRTSASRNSARLTRSILLGTVAVAFAIYWLADSYDADTQALLGYLQTSLLFVGFFAAVGIVCGALFWLLRALRRR